jgi:hypothetical protein
MCPQVKRSLTFLVLTATAFISSGCSAERRPRLNSDDSKALNQIYNLSQWSFQESSLELEVREGGAVELKIQGEATDEDRGGRLWLPIVLAQELPSYISVTDKSDGASVEFQEYKVAGGLWCVIAIVSVAHAAQSALNAAEPLSSPSVGRLTPFRLGVLMVSAEYSEGLPFLVPSGRGAGSVDAAIALPKGARFDSLGVVGDQEGDAGSPRLSALPSSITGGSTRAAVRLTPKPGTVWDFSGVTYSLPGPMISKLSVSLMGAVVGVLLLGYVAFVWARQGLPPSSDERLLTSGSEWSRQLRRLDNVASDAQLLSHKLEGSVEGSDVLKEMTALMRQFIDVIAQTREQPLPGLLIGELERLRLHLGRLIAQLVTEADANSEMKQSLLQLERKSLECGQEINRLVALAARRAHRLREIRTHRLKLALPLVAAIGLLTVMAVWVRGQANGVSPRESATDRFTTLGDFGMSVESRIPQSSKVAMTLDFFATTGTGDPRTTAEIGIGIPENDQAEFEGAITCTPADRVKSLHQSHKLARFAVPATSTPEADIFNLKGVSIGGLRDLSERYVEARREGNVITLECTVKDAQRNADTNRGGWLHYFPFDTKSIEIPLDFPQPAILSRIEITEPVDFVGDVTAGGLGARFVEADNEKKYRLDRTQSESRLAIAAGTQLALRAHFRRTWFQRLFLTLGQVLLAVLAGFGLGYVASLPDKSALGPIINGVGIVGLPWLMRTPVLAAYNLPSILAGHTITVFEIAFIISWALFVLVTIYAYRRFSG